MSLFSSLETPVSGGREFDGYSQPPSPVSEYSERFGQNEIQGSVDPPGDCASRPLAAPGTAATLAAVNFTPDHMRLIQSRMWELEQLLARWQQGGLVAPRRRQQLAQQMHTAQQSLQALLPTDLTADGNGAKGMASSASCVEQRHSVSANERVMPLVWPAYAGHTGSYAEAYNSAICRQAELMSREPNGRWIRESRHNISNGATVKLTQAAKRKIGKARSNDKNS